MNAPNFYNAANPASSDFDLLVQRIVQEIGGLWFPAGSGTPTRYDGAIGGVQMPTASGAESFRNAQKLESASVDALTLDGAVTETVILVPIQLLALSMQQDSDNIVDHGQIEILVDGKPRMIVYPGVAPAARTPYAWVLSLALYPGQSLGYAHTLQNAAGSAVTPIRLTFWGRVLHVPHDTAIAP